MAEQKPEAPAVASARLEKLIGELELQLERSNDLLRQIRAAAAGENPVRDAMDYWARAWQRRHRTAEAYQFARAKDPAQFKRLVGVLGLVQFKARMICYLSDSDDFVARQRHPLSLFWSRINTYGGPASGEGPDVFEPAAVALDCKHTPRCSSDQEHTRKRNAERRS